MSDLISRKNLLEILQKASERERGYGTPLAIIQWIMNIVTELPTVEERPSGEWIHDINNLYGCSVCCNRETMSNKKKKNFCPNCGADMRKKVE